MKLRIKVGNIEFEADGDSDEVGRERIAMTELLGHLAAINVDIVSAAQASRAELEKALPESSDTAMNYQSFNEFLKNIKTQRDTDLVMAAAYFLYKSRGMDLFTSKDIEDLLIESHVKRPGNISQSITQNIKKGYICYVREGESALKSYQVLGSADEWYEKAQKD